MQENNTLEWMQPVLIGKPLYEIGGELWELVSRSTVSLYRRKLPLVGGFCSYEASTIRVGRD